MMRKPKLLVATITVLSMTLLGCGQRLISQFSAISYENAVNLKVEASVLMGKATEPYAQHEKGVEAFNLKAAQALEFAKDLPLNTESTKQWQVLLNPSGHLLGGFLSEWREAGTLSPPYVKDKQDQIGKAFDEIIRLESGKEKPKQG